AEEAHELMRGLPEDRVAKDLKGAFTFLQKLATVNSENIGSIGWCMGGSYSLTASQVLPSLALAVICYGRLVTEEQELNKIGCPILGIFGETDRGIPAASVKIFERSAQKLEKNVRTVVYPNVGHGFMNPNNIQGYDEATTLEAWLRIHAFLELRLKGRK
ncbi:MAG: dienelactone hydrolase family protein, partial [Bacteroidetes bacterium]|nr:dienelactone hydrolase family protein [Bacteroidota bacterium]